MDCPICHVTLQMSERQGIEIDYCPQCRGIWLDRGELDKIIERSNAEGSMPERRPENREVSYNNEHSDKRYDHNDSHNAGYSKHRKKSFLSDLFEFGDD